MLSRRKLIARIAAFSGFAALIRRPAAAQTTAKIPKAAAKYQDHPNNMQMCGMCKFYIPPGGKAGSGMMGRGMMGGQMAHGMMAGGTCQLVEGQISPMGWCALYQPVSR